MRMMIAALGYAKSGASVIPLKPGQKIPFLAWKKNQTARMTEDQIRAFWKMQPDANVGLATGSASGFFVLDCDTPQAVLEVLRRGMPLTATVKTGNGLHYYFKLPDFRVGNRAGLLPNVDVRADGGYVVAPPSLHPGGKRYDWQALDLMCIERAPQWLLDMLRTPTPKATVTIKHSNSRYGQFALDAECRATLQSVKGARNNQLNLSAFRLGQLAGDGLLTRAEIESRLLDIALRIGLSEKESLRTIDSGLTAGIANPRSERRA